MLSSAQRSQVLKRSTFLTQTTSFHSPSTQSSRIYKEDTKPKELRRYPTDSKEFVQCKTDNRYHHNILNRSREEHKPQYASPNKIFELKEKIQTIGDFEPQPIFKKKNQSVGNLASWHFTNGALQNTAASSRPLSKKLDVQVPLKDLMEITKQLDNSSPEEIRLLSKSYVNEMVHLSQTITRTLKTVRR